MNTRANAGCFGNGLPYNRFGRGPEPLLIVQGLQFENRPLSPFEARFMLGMYNFLQDRYTVYVVARKPGLPEGYTLGDMGDDYAVTVEQAFGAPVDIIGISTGGSIVQHFAADHPNLVRRLVIHSSAHTLAEPAKAAQLAVARLAGERKWREAWAVLLRFMQPPTPITGLLVWLGAHVMARSVPEEPSDLIVTVAAEDQHCFRSRLHEIVAPTLVIAGACDPFYSEQLFRETAAGIPDARLILYPKMGHPARGKQFGRDVLAFLGEKLLETSSLTQSRRDAEICRGG
jgi:pimeloyl-ACP methyl ester carboxylesterase